MTAIDEMLPAQIGRRNWIIFAILVALSAFWQSLPFTLGVAGGGMVSIISYRWLHRSLTRTLARPTPSSPRSFQVRYLLRLTAVGLFIYVLLDRVGVHPLGLALGLSVVMINILGTTAARAFRHRG